MLAKALEKKTFRDRYPGCMTRPVPGYEYLPDPPPILDHNWRVDISKMIMALTARS